MLLLLSPLLLPMIRAAQQFSFMVRPTSDLYILSASVLDFLIPNRLHTLFRPASFTWPGNQIAPISERTIAIGYTALALALITLWRRRSPGEPKATVRNPFFWLVSALFFFMLALGPTRTQARAGTLACAIVAVAVPWIVLAYDGGYLAMMRGEAFRAWVADAQNLAPLAGAYWRWSWISPVAVSMLAAGAWAFRRGRADDRRFVQVAPLVALAVLPLVWGYTLTMLYPAVVAWVDEAREKP